MKKNFLTFLLLCATALLNAKSFSLQIVQRNTGGENIFDASYIVEQTIMDYFFDRGTIVSNNSVIVSDNDAAKEKTQLRRSFVDAQEGGMNLFIKLFLNYSLENSTNPSAVLLSNIRDAQVEVVSVSDLKVLLDKKFVPKKVNSFNDNRGGVEAFATDMAVEIQARLAKKDGAL